MNFISISGLQMFSSYIPNVVRTLHSTIFENRLYLHSESPVFYGVITLVAFTASIYHLLLLGAQRIYAVKWPLQFRTSSMKPVYGMIAMVWIIALVIASTPGKLACMLVCRKKWNNLVDGRMINTNYFSIKMCTALFLKTGIMS